MAAGTLTELEENDLLSLMIKARDDETNNSFTDQLINPIYAGMGLMCPDRYKMWCGLFKNYRMTLKFLDFNFFSVRNMFPVSFFFSFVCLGP